jgi:hypothetical protein
MKFKIKNLSNNQKYYRQQKRKFEIAGATRLLIVLLLLFLYFFGNTLVNRNRTSLKDVGRTVDVKAVEVAEKQIDYDLDPMSYLRFKGRKIGYDDYDITKFHQLLDCENGLHTPDRKNYLYDGEDGHYTAGGIAMITNSTWKAHKCEGSKWDATDNIDCFYKIIGDNQGLGDYRESRKCWGNKFNVNSLIFIKVK